jgi:hypothetical protein
MIDFSKVRIGDELQIIPCKVVGIDLGFDSPFRVKMPDGCIRRFGADEFIHHIPAPRPFENGEIVTWGDGSKRATFLMSHGNMAFVAREDDTPDTIVVANLRRVDAISKDEIVVTDEEVNRAINLYTLEFRRNEHRCSWRAALVDFLKRRKEAGR